MKSLLILGALVVLGNARPQEFQWDVIEAAPDPPTVVVPIGAKPETVTYDPDAAASSAAALILADPLPQEPQGQGIKKRAPCSPQPTGAGPIPSPDTASSFQRYAPFAAAASSAPVPSGYTNTFTNLNASNSAYGYMGYTVLNTYSSVDCANVCNSRTGCSAFNLLFERDPSVEPAAGCPDPASTTVIKCVFWGGPVTSANANNDGQWRNQFHVVIAGSNGYVSNSIESQDGFVGPDVLGTKAINAPLAIDCAGNSFDTYMGSKVFTSGPFDAGLCSIACSSQSAYNLRHPPAKGKPKTCQFFNTYLLLKNGVSVGQTCAMYTQAWDSSYAKNEGQWRGNDRYTIAYSYTFTNSTNPGTPDCSGSSVSSATSAIIANNLQPFCSSLLGYTTPVITVVATESTAVPSTTIIETSVPLTTETVTSTSLVAVTQNLKRDFTQPTAACTHNHGSVRRSENARRKELVPFGTDTCGNFVDSVITQSTPASRRLRRDVTPLALSGFSNDVTSSACSLQATPVTSTSTILSTTTQTYTSGAIPTTTVLGLSTVTDTVIIIATTTIKIAPNAPSGAIGYLTFGPRINAEADYALSDDATHMTDNFYTPDKRETFIVTADGYLYSVTNNAYYYIFAGGDISLLYWASNKLQGLPIFSAGVVDGSGRSEVFMKDTSTGSFYSFCLKTSASGDGNGGSGLHFYGIKAGITRPGDCESVELYILAV